MDDNQLYKPLSRPEIVQTLRSFDAEVRIGCHRLHCSQPGIALLYSWGLFSFQVQDEIDGYELFALHRFNIYCDMYLEVRGPNDTCVEDDDDDAPSSVRVLRLNVENNDKNVIRPTCP